MSFHVLVPEPIDFGSFTWEDGRSLTNREIENLVALASLFPKRKNHWTEDGHIVFWFTKDPSSGTLKRIVWNYKKYMALLVNSGNYEENPSYSHPDPNDMDAGYAYCKKYWPNENHLGRNFRMRPFQIFSVTLIGNLHDHYAKSQERDIQRYPHLVRWLKNDNLNIDLPGAMANLESLEIPPQKYNADLNFLHQIHDQNIRITVSSKMNRLFSPLTGMRKSLRSFITYRGERLEILDIKNSVPFFSTFLFNPDRFHQLFDEVEGFSFLSFLSYYHYMLQEKSQLIENTDVSEYINHCRSGEIYERYQEQLHHFAPSKHFDRRSTKVTFFKSVFSSDDPNRMWYGKQAFLNLYPSVFNIFAAIKHEDHSVLANGLMSMESFFVLDTLTRKFARRYRNVPLYTIHDGIATVQSQMPRLEGFFRETAAEFFGLTPRYEIESFGEE
jgi:hypothetical protein